LDNKKRPVEEVRGPWRKPAVSGRDAIVQPETPKDVAHSNERVSLHGPSYEEVLAGLLKVDPKALDKEPERDGNGAHP
jgi:hypothetical protein